MVLEDVTELWVVLKIKEWELGEEIFLNSRQPS